MYALLRHVPIGLIYARLLIGLLLFALSFAGLAHFAALAIVLVTFGLLTDIFDGIIARQLKVSSEKLRRMDSTIDQLFWGLVTATAYVRSPAFFARNATQLWLLLAAEGLTYAVCFLKFRKEIATHAWASKAWALVSFAALLEVIVTGHSTFLFALCFYVGILSRVEVVAILLALRKWTNDVPSFYHALRLRQGRDITRHKLLNG